VSGELAPSDRKIHG